MNPKSDNRGLSGRPHRRFGEVWLLLVHRSVCFGRPEKLFSLICPWTGKRTTKCKVNGVPLKVVNFTSLRDMIPEDAPPEHVHNPKTIKRKHCGIVLSEPETKEDKVVWRSAGLWTTLTPFHMDISNLFINRGALTNQNSFHSMTLKLQHPFALTVAGPSSCKSKFVIRLLECRQQLFDVFRNIVWCHSENNARIILKTWLLLKAYRTFKTLKMYLHL